MSESNNNASSGTIAGMVLVIALAIAIPFVIKHYLMPQYIEAWYWFKYYLIKPIHWLATLKFIAAHFDSFFFWVDWMFIDMNIPKGQLVQIISDTKSMLDSVDDTSKRALYLRFTDVDDTLNSDFKNSSRLIYAIYSPVYLFICAMLVVKILRKDHYDTTYSLDSFVKKMSKGFPEILPVAYDNPQHERDLDIGKWRSSPKAYDYLNNLNCLKMIDKSGRDFFSLDIDKVRELLVEQLGSKWTGFNNLDLNYKRVAGCVLPMVVSPARGRDETERMVALFAKGHSSKPRFIRHTKSTIIKIITLSFLKKKDGGITGLVSDIFSIPDSIKESYIQRKCIRVADRLVSRSIKKYSKDSAVTDLISLHNYDTTVLSALIEKARKGGVFPSCSFIWLKHKDRKLYYTFNNLGRKVSWIEVVGFWAHYVNEKAVRAPFPSPRVENGIEGIDDYFQASFYNYVPFYDRSDY